MDHRRRPPQRTASFPSAQGLRPWLLVLLFSIVLLLFLPSFLSKGLRPAAAGLIKNGWDALNFLLVLFAILCGLLSRNSNPDDSPRHQINYQKSQPAPATPSFNDGLTYQYHPSPFNRHRRSSSYPDLRQEAFPAEQWRSSDDIQLSRSSAREAMPQAIPAEQWRFSDDIQPSRSSAREAMPQSWKLDDIQFQQPDNSSLPELDPKTDENVLSRSQNNSLYTEEVKHECKVEAVVPDSDGTPRRMRSSSSYPDLRQEWIPAEDWRFFDDIDLHRRQPERRSPEVRTIPVDTVKLRTSTPPSPPPPPPRRRRTVRKIPKRDPEPETPAPPPPRAPPPPPPLPPPTPPRQHQRKKSGGGPKDLASALAHYYQKKRKKSGSRSKTAHDSGVAGDDGGGGGGGGAAPPPPPPMPPPPSSVFNKLFNHKKSGGKSKKVHTAPPPPPPPPPQISRLSSPLPPTSPHSVRRRRERSSSNSNLRTPPPPPPQAAAAESPATSCPPSPDVNNKADMFIARFRAGLQLEKQNSIKARTPHPAAAPVAEEEEIMVIGTLFD